MWESFALQAGTKLLGSGSSARSPVAATSGNAYAGGLNSGNWSVNLGGSTAPGALLEGGAASGLVQLVMLAVAGGLVLVLAAKWLKKS